jgi:hypothetical protein
MAFPPTGASIDKLNQKFGALVVFCLGPIKMSGQGALHGYKGFIRKSAVVPIPTDLAAFQAGKKFFQVVSGHIVQ